MEVKKGQYIAQKLQTDPYVQCGQEVECRMVPLDTEWQFFHSKPKVTYVVAKKLKQLIQFFHNQWLYIKGVWECKNGKHDWNTDSTPFTIAKLTGMTERYGAFIHINESCTKCGTKRKKEYGRKEENFC